MLTDRFTDDFRRVTLGNEFRNDLAGKDSAYGCPPAAREGELSNPFIILGLRDWRGRLGTGPLYFAFRLGPAQPPDGFAYRSPARQNVLYFLDFTRLPFTTLQLLCP